MPEETERTWECMCCHEDKTGESTETVGGYLVCEDCMESSAGIYACANCDELILGTHDQYFYAGGGDSRICTSCYEEEYFTCANCDAVLHQDSECYSEECGSLCEYCYEETVFCCARCERHGNVDGAISIDDSFYCRECALEIAEEIIGEAVNCTSQCEDCAANLRNILDTAIDLGAYGFGTPYTCCDCGRSTWETPRGNVFDIARAMVEGEEGEYSCCSRSTGAGYRVLNYSAKPPLSFKSTGRDLYERALHFGTEVELELKNEARRTDALISLEKADTERIFYCKEDSSIDNGFELVTHPFTFDWMKENGQAFEGMFALSSLMTGWDSEDCGMHIHMSADAFTNLQLFKFMRFFYMNREYIERLSRRRAGKIERWAEFPKDMTREKTMRFAIGKRDGISIGRGALNFQRGQTIECRVFRSTLSPTVYYGNIEFLQSLFDYTKNCGADDSELTVLKYLNYTAGRAKAFKNFLTLNELIPTHVMDEMEV